MNAKAKVAVFAAVVLLAAGLAARSFIMRGSSGDGESPQLADTANPLAGLADADLRTDPASDGKQASGGIDARSTENPRDELETAACGTALDSVAALVKAIGEKGFVYVLLPDKSGDAALVSKQINGAIKKLSAAGVDAAAFTLPKNADGRDKLVSVYSITSFPSVLAMGKSTGMQVISGEITEPKLLRAYVTACAASACGSGGCPPKGSDQ